MTLEEQLLEVNGGLKKIVVLQGQNKDRLDGLQRQLDAIDRKTQGSYSFGGSRSLADELKSNDQVARMIAEKRGHARIELAGASFSSFLQTKTVTSSGLLATPNVLQYELDRGIVAMARPVLRMRDVIPSRPTSLMRVAWLKETVRPTKASPVAEAGQKLEVAPTVTSDYEDVKKIAIITKASDEVMTDPGSLASFLQGELRNRVLEEMDLQILSGAGTGDNLNGLTTQAQSWDISILTASDGYEYADIIEGAAAQIAADNELAPTFVVLHPADWHKIRRCKTSVGEYLWGAPNSGAPDRIWEMAVVPTTQMAQGYFLVGSGDPAAAEIREKLGVTIDISNEDDTNFQYNLVTIRAEWRGCLVVKRPNSFVYGQLAQSPE